MFRSQWTPKVLTAALVLTMFGVPNLASADDDRCDRRGRGNAYGHYKQQRYNDARYRDSYRDNYRGNGYRDSGYNGNYRANPYPYNDRNYSGNYRYQQPRSAGTSAAIIGGTAAAGAGVGAVLGGWKGAVLGGTAGAAGGVIYDQATRNNRRR